MQPGQGPPPGGYGAPQQPPAPYGYGPSYGGPLMRSPWQPFDGTCPKCRSGQLHRPSFTWWGGLLGPKLLNHTVCGGCGSGFNAKTGKSNSTAIGIYLSAGLLLGTIVVRLAL